MSPDDRYLQGLPPVPSAAPAARTRSRKTVLLWLFLLLFFFAVYQVLTPERGDDAASPQQTTAQAPEAESTSSRVVRALTPLLPVLLLGWLLLHTQRKANDTPPEDLLLDDALGREDFDRVAALAREGLTEKTAPGQWAARLTWLTRVALERGEWSAALSLAGRAEAALEAPAPKPGKPRTELHAMVLLLRAHAQLALSHFDAAEATLARLEGAGPFLQLENLQRLYRAVLLAGRGERQALRAYLEQHEVQMHDTLVASQRWVLVALTQWARGLAVGPVLAPLEPALRARAEALLPAAVRA